MPSFTCTTCSILVVFLTLVPITCWEGRMSKYTPTQQSHRYHHRNNCSWYMKIWALVYWLPTSQKTSVKVLRHLIINSLGTVIKKTKMQRGKQQRSAYNLKTFQTRVKYYWRMIKIWACVWYLWVLNTNINILNQCLLF